MQGGVEPWPSFSLILNKVVFRQSALLLPKTTTSYVEKDVRVTFAYFCNASHFSYPKNVFSIFWSSQTFYPSGKFFTRIYPWHFATLRRVKEARRELLRHPDSWTQMSPLNAQNRLKKHRSVTRRSSWFSPNTKHCSVGFVFLPTPPDSGLGRTLKVPSSSCGSSMIYVNCS